MTLNPAIQTWNVAPENLGALVLVLVVALVVALAALVQQSYRWRRVRSSYDPKPWVSVEPYRVKNCRDRQARSLKPVTVAKGWLGLWQQVKSEDENGMGVEQ